MGRAEGSWPRLWDEASETRGWHQWLWLVRLAEAKAEIELARGRPEAAAEAAAEALELAAFHGRLKYELSPRLVLGSALLQLRREGEAVSVLGKALADAGRLRQPPSIVRAASRLGEALLATGDDAAAERAHRTARKTLDGFVGGLSEPHRESFLRTEAATVVLALSR